MGKRKKSPTETEPDQSPLEKPREPMLLNAKNPTRIPILPVSK